jgi:flagellar hook protein FlgE
MTFNIALTGLNAASADLNVTANNIANSNTVGFKESRAQFADFFLSNPYGVSETAVGGGVRVSKVAQQFSQGAINITNNSLDLAISGSGFFTLSHNGALSYTRAGAFGTDRDGFIVNDSGSRLQAYPPIVGGTGFNTANLSDIQLSTSDNPPVATTSVSVGVNLPAADAVPVTTPFSATDPTSYNNTTSLTVYDSLGTAHAANLFFVKGATANTWDVYTQIDGNAVGGANPITFNTDGSLATPAGNGQLVLPAYAGTNGSAPLNITLGLSNITQFGDTFSVNSLTSNGYATGRLSGIEVTQEGIVQARFTNGQATPLGQVAVANFANPQSLQQLGNTGWGETFASGPVIRGEANSSNFGFIQSGALESSNVDISAQLVNLITAQRSFQANAQVIQTADQITQTIIQL